jgi:phosphoribosylformimino-5-aminoimidazole carboxamide ribotide isomerase
MNLTLYPAIDLKDGACVRLKRGAMAEATVYAEDPVLPARAFQGAGCRWLHVVDLNGAFAGRAINAAAVAAILAASQVPVQLGGGIRDLAAIERWLELGIARVILGSAAVKNPALVRDATRAFPGRIAVGIDARDGLVATEGWAETSTLRAEDLALRIQDAGIAAVIFTDIGRDGMLSGVNVAATVALAARLDVPVIASGGVAGAADLTALAEAAAALAQGASAGRIEGVIVGRALYDGRLDIKTALAALAGGAGAHA